MKIYFLNHSGFMVEENDRAYVFDYNDDPENHVHELVRSGKEIWFFISHAHGDHFNPLIKKFDTGNSHFFLHADVKLNHCDAARCHVMHPGEEITVAGIVITMYGSTDEGGSFAVRTPENTYFHAGDLNWWHWLGDTDENNAQARANYAEELQRVKGLSVDVAFFPVDARLETAREWGVLSFLRYVTVQKCLIPMHYFGAPWKPSLYFKNLFHKTPLWIPVEDGEVKEFSNS